VWLIDFAGEKSTLVSKSYVRGNPSLTP
jgi:hypothetical protein